MTSGRDPHEVVVDAIAAEAVAMAEVIMSLKLPKGTRIVGTREGTEVHRKDGVSYVVRPITPRKPA